MKQLTLVVMLIVGSLTININATNVPSSSINASEDEGFWLSIGSDAYQRLKSTPLKTLSIKEPTLSVNSTLDSVKVIQISSENIDQLSQYMHTEFNRCGGFVFHENLEEAISYSQRVSMLNSSADTPSLQVNYTIDNPDSVNALLAELAIGNLDTTVSTLANYHNRYYTQQTGVDSANWIKSHWQALTQNRSDISVQTYAHSWNQPSVIATIQGAVFPDEVVVIGGHLDSINSSSPSSGRAPGADDNASGIAVITEALRAIVASGFKPARTIKFMGYAAEEVGLRGSKAIAQEHANSNANVVGVVQFDMTGYKGTPSKDIVFMTDYTNSAQNNFMMQLIDTYLSDISYGTSACGYGCSDHASWHNEGFAASMPFEASMGDHNSQIHTSNDSTFDANHGIKFSRLAVTFLAELAKSDDWNPPTDDNKLTNGVAKTGLSASQGNAINYTLDVPAGATDIKFDINGGSGDADLYVKFGSAPTDSSYDCRPYKNGNNETCSGTKSDGTYFVRVKAYSSFSGLSLTGSFTEDSGNPGEPIDETIPNISVSQGEWFYHQVDLTAGYSNLDVSISGGSGDADLYVRQSSQPTTSSYDCRPYKWGNDESCNIANPTATQWFIGIRGYNDSSGITLNIKATP